MQMPVNKNATPKAKTLLGYLNNIAGKKIITGQHTQTNPMEEIAYIEKVTAKSPKLRGFELLSYSPNIDYLHSSKECLTEVYENKNTLKTALKWALESNGIITLSFHWFSPLGGSDKSFYIKNTSFDAREVLFEGTPERKAFFHDLDAIAKELIIFRDENIPILWRPFHESDGEWFWWGAKGPEIARDLYKLMFDYFVNHYHLDNLLWVWNCRLKNGYPGDEYVDVISVDIYLTEYKKTDYADEYYNLINSTTKNKVTALAEIGYLPDIDLLSKTHIPWAYYMSWSKEFIIGEKYNSCEELKKMYENDYSIKLD